MSKPAKDTLKVTMFLEGCSIYGLIESYVQFTDWNVQVDTFKIVKKIRYNTFLGHLRMKKKNFFTAQREGIFTLKYFKQCACLTQDSKKQPIKK
jgi:hypothetical protein